MSGSFPAVHVHMLQRVCVILSWIFLLVGMFLAVTVAIKTISPDGEINPGAISLGWAVGILIFIPALFLFVVLNVMSTVAGYQRKGNTTG